MNQRGFKKSEFAKPLVLGIIIFCLLLNCGVKKSQEEKQKRGKKGSVTDLASDIKSGLRSRFLSKVNAGKRVYKHYCVVCHGQEGSGDGFNAWNLDPKPSNLTDKEVQKRSDSQLFRVINEGGPCIGRSGNMPAWGHTIKKEEVENIIAYIRFLGEEKEKEISK